MYSVGILDFESRVTGKGHEAYITEVLSRDAEEEENGEWTIGVVLIGEARK